MLYGDIYCKHLINPNKHLILESTCLSTILDSKFIGCNHFKIANEYLEKHHKQQIKW